MSEEANKNKSEDDVVTPWTVASQKETGVDYDKLISNKKLII